MIFIGQNFIQ